MRDTKKIRVKVRDSKDLAYLDRIFKAYEGLAMVTVPSGQKEYLVLDYPEETEAEVLDILHNLQPRLKFEIKRE